MTSTFDYEGQSEHGDYRPGRRRSLPVKSTTAMAALLGFAVLAAGCGGSNSPGAAGSGSSGVMAQGVAYARCMRSHGVSDFPDPAAIPGGGVAFQINGGPGSDLNQNNPTFQAADHACRSLLPGGDQVPPLSGQKLAAELKWARCMRSHGLPSFPDPNAQGAFDSSRFNDTSPAFQTARTACKSVGTTGPMTAVPGHGSGS